MELPKQEYKGITWTGETVSIPLYVDVPFTKSQKIFNETIGLAKMNAKNPEAVEIEVSAVLEMQSKYFQAVWASTEREIDEIDLDNSPELSQALNDRFARFQKRIKL